MEIKVRVKDKVVILDLCGRIDANSANLVEIVGQCIRDGYTDVLCNFEETSAIDYMGISALVLAYKELTNSGGRMRLVAIPEALKNLFAISGMDRVLEIFPDEDLAVNSFKEDKAIEEIKKMPLRRRFKRLPIDIKMELKLKAVRNPLCLQGDIVNLSAIGAFIFGCEHFKLGDEVLIRFKLGPAAEEFTLDAKVVWLADKQVQPHFYPGIGIEFVNISNEIQEKIFEFVERNASLLSNEE
ncbi:MAG: anti-sigma factor antagonist [Candidatus Omnitrophica bacterium]|nr:anti-sigma factor antagonist [Candidatus Omnitrophota bacterium]